MISTLASAKILFVNEVWRHGARAPEIDGATEMFKNGKGMLTSSGMRQHYMIGNQLRKRYVKNSPQDDKLLSENFKHDEVYVRSTQVHRTIQSAESQMLGMFPFNSSDADAINTFSITKYQPVPIHNYGQYVDDMVAYGSCPFMVNDYLRRSKDPQIWEKYDKHFRPLIYDQISNAFNISSKDIDFINIYPFSDILWAEDFEGIQNRFNFTEDEWKFVKQIQLPSLVELLSDVSNKIMVSRMVNPVVEMMKSKIGLSFNETLVQKFVKSKFLLFSSHDYQMSHILKFLAPTNLDYKWIEYASVLIYELHSIETPECVGSKSKDCFTVKIFYNFEQLQLPWCKKLDCSFSEFESYIIKTGLNYDQIQKQCYKEELLPEAENIKLFNKGDMFNLHLSA